MSRTPLRRALYSAITLFGGHFSNRRLDRVAVIGATVTAVVVGTIAVSRNLPLDDSGFNILGKLPVGLLVVVASIALVSARLTFRDAQQPVERPQTLAIRLLRYPVTLFGLLLFALIAAAGISSVSYLVRVDIPSFVEPEDTVAFGNNASISYAGAFPKPPSGPERLRGRITLQGAGIADVEISLLVNDEYEVQHPKPTHMAFSMRRFLQAHGGSTV